MGTSCLPGAEPPGVLKNPPHQAAPPPLPTPVEVLSRWGPDLPRRQRGCPVEQSLNLYAETPSQFTPHEKGTTCRQDGSVVVMCARPPNGKADYVCFGHTQYSENNKKKTNIFQHFPTPDERLVCETCVRLVFLITSRPPPPTPTSDISQTRALSPVTTPLLFVFALPFPENPSPLLLRPSLAWLPPECKVNHLKVRQERRKTCQLSVFPSSDCSG